MQKLNLKKVGKFFWSEISFLDVDRWRSFRWNYLCPDKKLNKTEEEEIYAEFTIFLRDIESAQCIQIFFSVSSSRMYHVTIIAVKW